MARSLTRPVRQWSEPTLTLPMSPRTLLTRPKSNGTGEYRLDNLLPGTYHVTVKAQGFKAFAQTTDVQLNKTGTLNVTLTPGATTETVEVSGAPPIIDTTTCAAEHDV